MTTMGRPRQPGLERLLAQKELIEEVAAVFGMTPERQALLDSIEAQLSKAADYKPS